MWIMTRIDMGDHATQLDAVVSSGRSLQACMDELIAYCQEECPDKVWEAVAGLDFQQGAAALRDWLEGVLTDEPPGPEIDTFWFGLEPTTVPGGRHSYSLYIAGSDHFDIHDAHWTRLPAYWPSGRHANSMILLQVQGMLLEAGGPALIFGQYLLGLGYSCLAITEACQSIPHTLLLGTRDRRRVAVGFDDGDYLLLGIVDKRGWHLLSSADEQTHKAKALATSRPGVVARVTAWVRTAAARVARPRAMPTGVTKPARAPEPVSVAAEVATARASASAMALTPPQALPAARAMEAQQPVTSPLPAETTWSIADQQVEVEAQQPIMPLLPPETTQLAADQQVEMEAQQPIMPLLPPETTQLAADQQVEMEAQQPITPPLPAETKPLTAGQQAEVETQQPTTLPLPALMRTCAREAVDLAWARFQTKLDYSEESIEHVERILSRLYDARSMGRLERYMDRVLGRLHGPRPDGLLDEPIDRLLAALRTMCPEGYLSRLRGRGIAESEARQMARIWGAYIGEVMRQRWGGEWTARDGASHDTALAIRVRRSTIYPLARVYERLRNGPQDNIWFYYRAIKQWFDMVPQQKQPARRPSWPAAQSAWPATSLTEALAPASAIRLRAWYPEEGSRTQPASTADL
jgi:hypothetical protein